MPLAVVDAWAVLAWLGNEPGADIVDRWLGKAATRDDPLHLSMINAGEIFYRLIKTGEANRASDLKRDLRKRLLPIQLMPATNPRVWRAAALKGRYAIAYADAFAAALAIELQIPVLTGILISRLWKRTDYAGSHGFTRQNTVAVDTRYAE